MKTILMSLPLVALLMLSGCLDKKDRMEATGPTIHNVPPPIQDALDKQADKIKDNVRKDMDVSQNAIQQNLQSLLGVSVGKLSDDLIKANMELKDLLHAEISTKIGEIQNNMSASLASNNDLRAMIKAQMELNAKLEADIRAQVEINAKLEAKVSIYAAGQAGVNNKLDQYQNELKQELKAGRDVNNSTVQFNKEMLEALRSANQVTEVSLKQFAVILLAIISLVGTIFTIMYRRRAVKAETKNVELDRDLKTKQMQFERAIAMLPPPEAERIFPKGQ